MRRCIGCMTSYPKDEVVRLVEADGSLVIDLTGKMNGRGAYLCRSLDCLELAMKKRRFSYALGISMSTDDLNIFKNEYAKVLEDAEVNG